MYFTTTYQISQEKIINKPDITKNTIGAGYAGMLHCRLQLMGVCANVSRPQPGETIVCSLISM